MRLTRTQEVVDDAGRLVRGRWTLDRRHRISYRAEGKRETSVLEARIIDAKPGGLSVVLTRRSEDQRASLRIFRLKGRWRLDPRNRIRFEVLRSRGATDSLTFRNAWTINQNHEVIYTYKESTLRTRRRIDRTLTFAGHWDILEKNRLTYFIARGPDSAFRVRGAFQTRSILAKEGAIRYQFGIELERLVRARKLVLFGK